GLDHVLAQGGLDESRLAITGGSYGGFMTNWAIGHTDRFACAVAVNSISNLFSFFGTSDIGALWTEKQLGGPYWRKPEWYRERSPLTYVERVRTPLLLIHAETDFRCPIEQSEQMFVALRVQGKETEMVRIPNASHALASTAAPRHRVDRWRLSKAWFDRYFGI
nr:prolyl oligopeptidase family serine peptidase [Chloroflexota bacterium]